MILFYYLYLFICANLQEPVYAVSVGKLISISLAPQLMRGDSMITKKLPPEFAAAIARTKLSTGAGARRLSNIHGLSSISKDDSTIFKSALLEDDHKSAAAIESSHVSFERESEEIVPSEEIAPSDSYDLSHKESRKNAIRKKHMMQRIEKLQRQDAAKLELGHLNLDNPNPKLTFNVADGSLIDLVYSQAFVTKHLGEPDRGPHGGTHNSVLQNPQDVILSGARIILNQKGRVRYGVPGKDIPMTLLESLGIKVITNDAKFKRMAIPSFNMVAIKSYIRTAKEGWEAYPLHGSESRIEFEGYLIPQGFGGLQRDTIIVDHMHHLDS